MKEHIAFGAAALKPECMHMACSMHHTEVHQIGFNSQAQVSLWLQSLLCCARYPEDAWEVLLGYDQEKAMGLRAGDAMLRSIKQADAGSLHL